MSGFTREYSQAEAAAGITFDPYASPYLDYPKWFELPAGGNITFIDESGEQVQFMGCQAGRQYPAILREIVTATSRVRVGTVLALTGPPGADGPAATRSAEVTIAFGDVSGLGVGVKKFQATLAALADLPPDTTVGGIVLRDVTPWDDGGGGGTMVVRVGTAADEDLYTLDVDIALGTVVTFPRSGLTGAEGFSGAAPAADILVTIESDTDLNAFTAGSVTAYLKLDVATAL